VASHKPNVQRDTAAATRASIYNEHRCVPQDPPGRVTRGGASNGTLGGMGQLLVGYARVSTDGQDLTVQRQALEALGVAAERVYVDHGLTGTNRDRAGLRDGRCQAG
jgi:1,6-anhydro-N-acetylmuramate kinase